MAAITSIIGVALSAIGTGIGFVEKKSAEKKQKRQAAEAADLQRQAVEKEKALRDLQTTRERRKVAREAQLRRANIVAGAEAAGISAGGSSGLAGATAAVQSQAGSNQSFLSQTNVLQDQAATLFGRAQETAARPIFQGSVGSTVGAIGNLAFQAGQSDVFGDQKSFSDIFS